MQKYLKAVFENWGPDVNRDTGEGHRYQDGSNLQLRNIQLNDEAGFLSRSIYTSIFKLDPYGAPRGRRGTR